MSNFTAAMKFVSKWEWNDRADGAYTNDKVDPGGETKFGISKRANPELDIANLTLAQAMDVYYKKYWLAFNLDAQVYPLVVAVFDSYVQHRPAVVAKLIKDASGDLQKFLELRRIFYLNLIGANPSQIKYKNGWLARINDLSKYLAILVQENSEQRPPSSTPSST